MQRPPQRYGHWLTRPRRQRGVVLVICLLILLALTINAGAVLKGLGTSQTVAGNARRQLVASQAAEAALLYCEQQVANRAAGDLAAPAPRRAPGASERPEWENLANWDGPESSLYVTIVPLPADNASPSTEAPARAPECMAQYLRPGSTATVVITGRGFGPEVPAPDEARAAPVGAEVWLQSQLTFL